MKSYNLQEVQTKDQIRAFLDFPDRLYLNDPEWIRPLDNDIEKRFDPARNELFHGGEAIRWILIDQSGQTVGRIAAFYNREQSGSYEQPTGGCGFFECINDQKAAHTLFEAAKEWLFSKGMEAMDGPINFGDRSDFWGLLVEGFTEPLYCNPYNPPYYRDLFESYGFQNYFNQTSYIRQLVDGQLNPAVTEKAERIFNTPGYRFEHAGAKPLVQYAEDFKNIYNRAWAAFTGVKPINSEHARHLLKTLRPIIDVRLLCFAYYHDEPIGFFIMIPDINQIIKKFKGKFGIRQQLRLWIDLKVRKKVDRVFGVIFGVAAEFQGKGVEAGLIRQFEKTTDQLHYKTLQMAWVGDFNPVMMRMAESYIRATPYKKHVTYRYLFDRSKEFTRAPRLGKVRKK